MSMNNPVPNRMAPRQLPGVYMILCLKNNKRYYGQSQNISSRLSNHKSRLRRNFHEVPELQRDFNLYGENFFEFSAIYLSRDCTKQKLEALELEYIARHYDLCYNKLDTSSRKKENNPYWGKQHSEATRTQISRSLIENQKLQNRPPEGLAIRLKGELYPSISEASRQTNHSRDTIRRWLNDRNNLDCVQIDTSQSYISQNSLYKEDCLYKNTGKKKPMSLYGVKYASFAEAAKQLKCSHLNIQRLLKTDSENCFFL
jgi:group I intron endonuclease